MTAILIFPPGHSHEHKFASIFYKIANELESCLALFAIENQLDLLIFFPIMANFIFFKLIKNDRKN